MDRFRIVLGDLTRLPSDVRQGVKSSPVLDNKDGTGAVHLMKWSSKSIGIQAEEQVGSHACSF